MVGAVVHVGSVSGTAPPPPPGSPPMPDATNTGPRVSLTPYPATGGPFGNIVTGSTGPVLTVTTANAEIHGWHFAACRIEVAAAGVWIHDNQVDGHSGLSTSRGLINCLNSSALNCLVEYNNLTCLYPNNQWQGGVLGHDYTAQYNNVSQTVDGFGIYNNTTVKTYTNVTLLSNYTHDLSYFSPDPTHSKDTPVSKTHNDDGQWQGGLNYTAQWNNFEGTCSLTVASADGSVYLGGGDILRDSHHPNSLGGYNVFYPSTMTASSLQATDGIAAIGHLIFTDNWVGSDIKVHVSGSGGCPNSSIARNKFSRGRDGTNIPQIILTAVGSGLTWSGNVFADNGTPVQVIKDGVLQ